MTKGKTQLRELRASNPQVPMVSTIDIDVEEGDEVLIEDQEEENAEEGNCPSCRRVKEEHKALQQEAKALREEVASLSQALATSRKRSQRLARKLAKAVVMVQSAFGAGTQSEKPPRERHIEQNGQRAYQN